MRIKSVKDISSTSQVDSGESIIKHLLPASDVRAKDFFVFKQ